MDPLTVSAQFAAYMWFSRQEKGAVVCRTAAMKFARDHWKAFLPIAQNGVGRLLLRLAKGPRFAWERPVERVASRSASARKPAGRAAPVAAQGFSIN